MRVEWAQQQELGKTSAKGNLQWHAMVAMEAVLPADCQVRQLPSLRKQLLIKQDSDQTLQISCIKRQQTSPNPLQVLNSVIMALNSHLQMLTLTVCAVRVVRDLE